MDIEKHNELLEKRREILRAKQRYYAKRTLLNFCRYSMVDYENKPKYIVNWHHAAICKYLDLFIAKKIPRLIITTPPRHGKTELVSRRLPSFILGKDPDAEIIACSYSADLSSKTNRDVQRIITSPRYKELFADTQLVNKTQKQKTETTYKRTINEFEIINRNGVYRSCGVDGGISGMGANFIIVDDPIKNAVEAYSATYKQKVWDWYKSTLYTR
ncbi:MAG TPA: heat-shock protein Hsp70, partial [bacterium]|nr:heat-shock protein Hsp70 [bacterium]